MADGAQALAEVAEHGRRAQQEVAKVLWVSADESVERVVVGRKRRFRRFDGPADSADQRGAGALDVAASLGVGRSSRLQAGDGFGDAGYRRQHLGHHPLVVQEALPAEHALAVLALAQLQGQAQRLGFSVNGVGQNLTNQA